MKKSLTVGELKKLIKDCPDDLPVYANLYENRDFNFPIDCFYVKKASIHPASAINNKNFSITLGEGFRW